MWSFDELKSHILQSFSNGMGDKQLDDLYRIFRLNPNYPWISKHSLINSIQNTRDCVDIEEAARVIIDPYIYYNEFERKYYVGR